MTKELRALFAALVLCVPLVAATSGLAAASDKRQNSQEPKTQQELIREVRHQMVLLPYYSVFDNLAYRVDGDKVILEGQGTKSAFIVLEGEVEVRRNGKGLAIFREGEMFGEFAPVSSPSIVPARIRRSP